MLKLNSTTNNTNPQSPRRLSTLTSVVGSLAGSKANTSHSLEKIITNYTPGIYVWKYENTFAGKYFGEEIGKQGWDFIMGTTARILFLCVVTTINYILICVGMFELSPFGTAITLIGSITETLIIWGTFPFMVNADIHWSLVKQGDLFLYDALAIVGGLCLGQVLHWDARTSVIFLLVAATHGSSVIDAYHPTFMRFNSLFSVFTSSFFAAIMVCLSLGVFPNVQDEVFDLGTLGGISIRTQTYSVLQLGISCYATLAIFSMKNAIHSFITGRSIPNTKYALMRTLCVPVYVELQQELSGSHLNTSNSNNISNANIGSSSNNNGV
jgi:hypothetical protein